MTNHVRFIGAEVDDKKLIFGAPVEPIFKFYSTETEFLTSVMFESNLGPIFYEDKLYIVKQDYDNALITVAGRNFMLPPGDNNISVYIPNQILGNFRVAVGNSSKPLKQDIIQTLIDKHWISFPVVDRIGARIESGERLLNFLFFNHAEFSHILMTTLRSGSDMQKAFVTAGLARWAYGDGSDKLLPNHLSVVAENYLDGTCKTASSLIIIYSVSNLFRNGLHGRLAQMISNDLNSKSEHGEDLQWLNYLRIRCLKVLTPRVVISKLADKCALTEGYRINLEVLYPGRNESSWRLWVYFFVTVICFLALYFYIRRQKISD